jgi:2',3'-cyclic-nucleotide 2'-phosphodiesterase (5'-nucleotidase family)
MAARTEKPGRVRAGLSAAIAATCALLGGLGVSLRAGADTKAAQAESIDLLSPLDSTNSDSDETSYGSLVADAVRVSGNADVAIVPAAEFVPQRFDTGRHTIEELAVALRNAQDPTDQVVVLNLTGEQLQSALERSVSHAPMPFTGFLQVSGIRFRYRPGSPIGKRIDTLTVDDGAIDPKRTYTVATTTVLADGSFGYFRVWTDKAIARKTDISIVRCFSQYLAVNHVPNLLSGGRIVKEE